MPRYNKYTFLYEMQITMNYYDTRIHTIIPPSTNNENAYLVHTDSSYYLFFYYNYGFFSPFV